jgi:hypothetical protein
MDLRPAVKTNLIDTRAAAASRHRIDRERNEEGGAARLLKATAPSPSPSRPYWEKAPEPVQGTLAA